MKRIIKLLTIGLIASAVVGIQPALQAQEAEAPAAKEKAANADRPLPFNGKLKAIDKDAMTVTVGNRTFKLTEDTKYLQGDLSSAKIGEKVGGSYRKAEDGTLVVNSIRFGPKEAKE